MKRIILSNAILILSAFLYLSCQKDIEVTTFHSKLEIVTPSISQGRDFSFRIYSNTGSFILESFECTDYNGLTKLDFPFKDLKAGSEYKCDSDGWVTFTAKGVNVIEKSIGTLNVTVKDRSTGGRETMNGTYRKYRGLYCSSVQVQCQNHSFYENGMVVAGDTLKLVLTTNLTQKGSESQVFEIKDFMSPFGSEKDNRFKGSTHQCDRNGRVTLDLGRIQVNDERKDSIVMVLSDPATRDTVHAKAIFDMYHRLDATFQADDFNSSTGILGVHFTSSKKKISITEFSIPSILYREDELVSTFDQLGFKLDNTQNQLRLKNVIEFNEQDLNTDAFYRRGAQATDLKCRQDGSIRMISTIKDEVTQRICIDTCIFKVAKDNEPYCIRFLRDDGAAEPVVCERVGDSNVLNSTYLNGMYDVCFMDDSVLGVERGYVKVHFVILDRDLQPISKPINYTVRLENSGNRLLSINPSKDGVLWDRTEFSGIGTEGEFWIRGGGKSGDEVVKVNLSKTGQALNDLQVDIPVHVKKRVAIFVRGRFFNKFGYCCNHFGSFREGWSGIPERIWCELVEYESQSSEHPIADIPLSATNYDLSKITTYKYTDRCDMKVYLNWYLSNSELSTNPKPGCQMWFGHVNESISGLQSWNDGYIGCPNHGHGCEKWEVPTYPSTVSSVFSFTNGECDLVDAFNQLRYCTDRFTYVQQGRLHHVHDSKFTINCSVSRIENIPQDIDLRYLVLEVNNHEGSMNNPEAWIGCYWNTTSPIRQLIDIK